MAHREIVEDVTHSSFSHHDSCNSSYSQSLFTIPRTMQGFCKAPPLPGEADNYQNPLLNTPSSFSPNPSLPSHSLANNLAPYQAQLSVDKCGSALTTQSSQHGDSGTQKLTPTTMIGGGPIVQLNEQAVEPTPISTSTIGNVAATCVASRPGTSSCILDEMRSVKRKLESDIMSLEGKIYDLESSYLNVTADVGNMLRGWEGYMSAYGQKSRKSAGVKTTQLSTVPVNRDLTIHTKDRQFSLTSCTSPAYNQMNQTDTTDLESVTGTNTRGSMSVLSAGGHSATGGHGNATIVSRNSHTNNSSSTSNAHPTQSCASEGSANKADQFQSGKVSKQSTAASTPLNSVDDSIGGAGVYGGVVEGSGGAARAGNDVSAGGRLLEAHRHCGEGEGGVNNAWMVAR